MKSNLLRKAIGVEVSLPCPGRSAEDVLTGFIVEDCFADHNKVTYSSSVELKLQFDDGLTSNVPKELIRHSTAPAPFKTSTPTNETVDHKEKMESSEPGKIESQEKAQLPEISNVINLDNSLPNEKGLTLILLLPHRPPINILKKKLQLMQNMTQKKRSLLWFSSSPTAHR